MSRLYWIVLYGSLILASMCLVFLGFYINLVDPYMHDEAVYEVVFAVGLLSSLVFIIMSFIYSSNPNIK